MHTVGANGLKCYIQSHTFSVFVLYICRVIGAAWHPNINLGLGYNMNTLDGWVHINLSMHGDILMDHIYAELCKA